MAQNTFPDGFPRDPIAAIDYSYFLTDAEKIEWRGWLQTANASQQEELVNTLHDLWVDAQKSAVPNGFNVNGSTPPQPQQQRAAQPPQPQQVQNNAEFSQPASDFIMPVAQQTQPSVAPQNNQKPAKPAQSVEEINNQNAKNFGNTKYSKNPLLDEDDNNSSNDFSFQNTQKEEANKVQKQAEAKKSQTQSATRFLNIKNLRESATREELEFLYSSYLKSRETNFKTEKDVVENHAMFLDKVMNIVVNFEQVADYYEAMTEKLLEMNDKLVANARDVAQIKNEYQNKQLSAQDEIDALKDRMDRFENQLRDLRLSNNKRFQEIQDEVSIFEADSLGYDGMAQRFELLESKISKLERLNKTEDSTPSIRDRFSQLQNRNQPRKEEESPTAPAVPSKTIDMRDEV